MSSWVPLRTAPSEPLCAPSTSYAAQSTLPRYNRLRGCHAVLQPRCKRTLQLVRCQASQTLQAYHNAYKLLHQSGRSADPLPQHAAPPQPDQPTAAALENPPQPASLPALKRTQTDHPLRQLPANPDCLDVPLAGTAPATSGDWVSPSSSHTAGSEAQATTPAASDAAAAAGHIAGAGTAAATSNKEQQQQPRQQQQQQQQRPYTPHSVVLSQWAPPQGSLQHQTALTHFIINCPTYTQLHQMIVDNAADFNAYHTCAALSRMLTLHAKGLGPRESRQFKEGCSTMQAILRRQLPDLQPRALVVAAYSLARLELPDRELLAGLAAAVEPHLSKLQPQGLSSLIWAFARQGHQPSPRWMDSLLSSYAADLRSFGPRDMATLLWALARLHYKVSSARLQQLLDHAKSLMGGFCGRSLSNLVYSLALSRQHPGEAWLAAVQERAVELGPRAFTPHGMCQLAWGLAKLGCQPSPALLNVVFHHAWALAPEDAWQRVLRDQLLRQQAQMRAQMQAQAQRLARGDWRGAGGKALQQRRRAEELRQQVQRLRELQAQSRERLEQRRRAARAWFRGGRRYRPYNRLDMVMLLYTLAVWGRKPPAGLARTLLSALQLELPRLEPNQLCTCLWACARLGIYPAVSWMRAFFDASYMHLPTFQHADLAQSLWALARLRVPPPEPWLSAALTRLQLIASLFSPVEVATTLWALAKLGVRGSRLPSEVLALFFIATDKRLSNFRPQELCAMIVALAHMRRRPDKEWTAEFLKVSYHKLASMNGWSLATLAWSLGQLALVPPPAWLYSYVNAARALLNATPVAVAAAPQVAAVPGLLSASEAGHGASEVPQTPLRTQQQEQQGQGQGQQHLQQAPGEKVGLSALDLGQIILALRQLNGDAQLTKVEDFLREAETRLAALKAGSGAYARQQVEVFLAMTRRQAGPGLGLGPGLGYAADGDVAAVEGAVEERDAQEVIAEEVIAEEEETLRKGGKKARGKADARGGVKKRQEAGVGGMGGHRLGGGEPAGAAVKAAGGKQPPLPPPPLAAIADAAAAVTVTAAEPQPAPVAPREVTRVLSSGARVTLALPSEVRLELGDLNVDLASPSGPATWHTSSGGGGGGGGGAGSTGGNAGGCEGCHGGGGGGGGSDGAAASTAEIKRQLFAV